MRSSTSQAENEPLMGSGSSTPDLDAGTVTPTKNHRKTYEQAVDATGFGRFNVWLTVVCGWANATDSVETMCVSLILPSVQCDLHATSQDLGWLTAVIFIGMLVGGYFWGSLGDLIGRRRVMVASLFVNGIFGLASSFSPNFWVFFFFRFMSGIGVGGSIPVIWSYYSEFQPSNVRGRMLSVIATFWMVGQSLTAGFAWIFIPQTQISFYIGSLEYSSWRIFVAISTATCLSASFLVSFLPESPKYLLEKGDQREAILVLSRAYQMNTGNSAVQYPVSSIEPSDIKRHTNMPMNGGMLSTFKRLWSQTNELFHAPLLLLTIAMLAINFCLSFGAYGLTLWLPELFARAREGGAEGPVCQAPTMANSTAPPSNPCDIDWTVFRDSLIIALSSLPGCLLTVLYLDKIGRKPIFIVGAFLSAVSAFGVYFVANQSQVLIMSCIFSCVSVVCWNCLDAFSTELFPTHVRATSMGVVLVATRIGAILGNVAFGSLVDTHCEIPIVLTAVILGVGGVVAFKLPETRNIPLV